MELKGKKIGVALTGSFCTYKKVFQELEKLAEEGAQIQTIFSDAAQSIDSRFGKAEGFCKGSPADHREKAYAYYFRGRAYRS